MKSLAIALFVTLANSAPAHAGACLGEDEVVAEVVQLETYAKNPKAPRGFLCIRVAFATDIDVVPKSHRKPLLDRIEKACTKVLEREHGDNECVELGIRLGKKSLGGVDFFDVVSKSKLDVWNWDRWTPELWMLGELGDARGAVIVRDTWKAAIDVAAKHEAAKRRGYLQAWAGWRNEAAQTIGKIGVAEDKAFLEEQAAATKDRYVRQACLEGAAEIERRLKKP